MTAHIAPHRWADVASGKLAGAERAAIERHAETCPACAKARDRVIRSIQTFPKIRARSVPEIGWDSIRARVHWSVAAERRERSRPRRWLVVASAFAAVIVLVIASDPAPLPSHTTAPSTHAVVPPIHRAPAAVIGLVSRIAGDVMIDGVRPTDAFDRMLGPRTVLATGNGRIDVQFGQASAFALGPRTTVELRRFDADVIELAIEGTIDLEVAPRARGQRFVVLAGDHTVEVRGTQFRVTHDARGTEVACRHGLVAVRDASHREIEVGSARRVDLRTHVLGDAQVVALSVDELSQLVTATPWVTPGWPKLEAGSVAPTAADATALARGSAPLDITTIGNRDVRVDGIELGEAPLGVRVMPGRHTIEAADSAGRFRRAGWVDVSPAHAARFDAVPVEDTVATGGPQTTVAQRKKQLAAGIDRGRLKRCTRAMTKQGLTDIYVQIEISVDAGGAVNFLNVIDTDLPSTTSRCVQEVLADVRFGAGPAATWREKIAL